MVITQTHIDAFEKRLYWDEKEAGTIKLYLTTVRQFVGFLDGRELSKDLVLDFKAKIMGENVPSTVNSKVGPLNIFLRFLGRPELCIKRLRIQKQFYYPEEKQLYYSEYVRLVRTAEALGNHRIALALQILCATGIRVGELRFITVEAAKKGKSVVRNKGKTRVIFIPEALREKILSYAKRQGIAAGTVILTSKGKPIERSNMWRYMNRLCAVAMVDPEKGHPHALRHLFAVTHYQNNKDPISLADILGHSDINTTRIYTVNDGKDQIRQINDLHLVL